jgi:hypothetical protein
LTKAIAMKRIDEIATHLLGRRPKVRDALSKAAGVRWDEAHRGHFDVAGRAACVTLDSADWIGLRMPLEQISDVACLELTHALPGNLRVTAKGKALELEADIFLDGQAHLPQSISEVVSGMSQATGQPQSEAMPPATDEMLASAIERLEWSAEPAVKLDAGYELRPRVAGAPVPVRLSIDGGAVLAEQVVLGHWPNPPACDAVALEALRLNGELRMARLAIRRAQVVCQMRLHGGLVQPRWLAMVAQAVAVCGHRCQGPLKLLAGQAQVAKCYWAMFGSTA